MSCVSARSQFTRAVDRILAPLGLGPGQRGTPRDRERPQRDARGRARYPGDFLGTPRLVYAPHDGDDVADPGEIVWTWVPYEEDYRRGKDRPVLVIALDDPWLLALPLTSKDHDRDLDQEAREGRYWVDIGTGEWDVERRPSEVRVNRIVRVDPQAVRRIAARIDATRFQLVSHAVIAHLGDRPGPAGRGR